MNKFVELTWLMERTMHKYIQYEKMPQEYCDGITLTQPEIHTVAIIGDQEGINITNLAQMRGITKGAASQMVYKLVDKGLVEKRVSPNSDSEINLYLSKMGKKARNEHRKKHETIGKTFSKAMDSVPVELQQKMYEFLQKFEAELDELLKK